MRGTNQTVVPPGETKELVSGDESPIDNYLSITGANAYLGRTPEQARAEFRPAPRDDRGRLRTEPDESVWVHAPETNTADVTIVRDAAGFFWDREPREVVRAAGRNGEAVATTVKGSIETDNYSRGEGFDFDGSAYPYSLDVGFGVEVLQITTAGDVVADVTTDTGDVVEVPLAGGSGVIDFLSISSVTFRDPNGTSARVAGLLGGDA